MCRQRQARGLTARAADADSGPSTSEVAAGDGVDLEADFDLLSKKVAQLTELLSDELKGCSIYLVGMMGSGKSTVGRMLANTLKYAFFDTDAVVELAHNKMSVADIFKEHGEEYFRKCESQVLKELAPYKSLVVATGGGAVANPLNWSYMHNGIVAWLQGDPTLLARRVVAEGVEKRPLLFGEGTTVENAYDTTLTKLTTLLDTRHKYYVNADVVVQLDGTGQDEERGAPTVVVMYRLLEAVNARIQETKAEREGRRNFTIERAGEVPSMSKVPSPAAEARAAAEE